MSRTTDFREIEKCCNRERSSAQQRRGRGATGIAAMEKKHTPSTKWRKSKGVTLENVTKSLGITRKAICRLLTTIKE